MSEHTHKATEKLNILIEEGRGHLFSLHEREIIFRAMDSFAGRSKTDEEKDKEISKITGIDNPWPLKDVLSRLVKAAKILLHKKDYDGHDYEEIEICLKRAEEIQELLNKH